MVISQFDLGTLMGKIIYNSLIFCLLANFAFGQALDSPEITCLQIDANGDVFISWNPPTDPLGEFESYQIWYSSATSEPFAPTLLATIGNYATTSFLHDDGAEPDAANAPACYFLVTLSNDGSPQESVESEIVCAPTLSLTHSAPLDGIAILGWLTPYLWSENPPAGYETEIWAEYPVGIWSQVGSVPNTEFVYEYPVPACLANMGFQIRINTPFGCQHMSDIESDVFVDEIPPGIPTVEFVTVDTTLNKAVLSWNQPPDADVAGYVVYTCLGVFPTAIDTIWDASITEFQIDANLFGPQSFTIAAFDSCTSGFPPAPDNVSPTEDICHKIVWLQSSWFNCQDFVTLNWNEYIGWDNGVDHYEILAGEVGQLIEPIGTVVGGVTTFVHENIVVGSQYTYVIKAFASDEALTSLSNKVVLATQLDQAPIANYLATATVMARDHVTVVHYLGSVVLEHTFSLEKRRIGNDYFTYVGAANYRGRPDDSCI